MLGAVGLVHGRAFDEDGGADIVAAVGIGIEFVEQIARAGEVPEVVMRVDDRQIRFDDFLGDLS